MKPPRTLYTSQTGWGLILAFLLWSSNVRATTSAEDSSSVSSPVSRAEESSVIASVGDTTTSSTSQEGSVEPFSSLGADPVGEPYFIIIAKLGFGLGLVILLVWGTVWLLRKSSLGQKFGAVGSTIRVVERSFLSPKKAIYLVEIGDRTLALGVTEENIALLTEWQAGELDISSIIPQAPSSFATQFKTLLGQVGKEAPVQGR